MKWGSLSDCLSMSVTWCETSEEKDYWSNMYSSWCNLEGVAEQELLKYLEKFPARPLTTRKDYISGNYLLYENLKIIAKYWDRFGNLPSSELLEGLV